MYDEDEQIDVFSEKESYVEIGEPESCLFACGRNQHREMTIKGHTSLLAPAGVKEPKNQRTFSIGCGSNHTALLTESGYLYMMGSTLHGKIGIPNLPYNNVVRPKLFPMSKEDCVVQVECAEFHTLCLFEDGRVFSWGGTLHKKTGNTSPKPSLVLGIDKVVITKVGCGRYHSMALSSKDFFLVRSNDS